ncbi:HNH/ENDO VII family nuclease, partial [Austwickia sp. TVS 96-490-7B]|uniref:HNH/ENDO VII family nuclease n=1 Tax=Austwickia sp. TVS 96-490-7B TaxID=2830843 RepID=UPI001C581FBE
NPHNPVPNPTTWTDPWGLTPQEYKKPAQTLKYWSRGEFHGTRVYKRDDLIDPAMIDEKGRSNIQRMKHGRAPLGQDGKTVNLHHMLQTPDGPIAEISQTMHQANSRVIHIFPNTTPSSINRAHFGSWRRAYWRNRSESFNLGES